VTRVKERRERWEAVAALPGKRITRRITSRITGLHNNCEFLDERGVIVATQKGGNLVVGSQVYVGSQVFQFTNRFTLIDAGSDNDAGDVGGVLQNVDVAPGPALSFRLTDRPSRFGFLLDRRWQIGAVLNQSGDTVLTVRWLPQETSYWAEMTGSFSKLGEAVIAPGVELPVSEIPLVVWAFNRHDQFGRGGG
jgi:hypothetical protein